jgi:hypothetical protein
LPCKETISCMFYLKDINCNEFHSDLSVYSKNWTKTLKSVIMNDTCPIWGNRSGTKKSLNLKSSSELTYRMFKLCKCTQVITLFTQFRPDFFLNILWSKDQNFFQTLGGQIIYFIYKNCQTPPRNQLVVPKINQEINEPSYEMVGVT